MLDCESRDPVLVKIRSKNSFYGHPFPSVVSIRAATSFLRKTGHSILINYLGGDLEQCRSVNPLIGTGVFNPFKLTDRSVIIGSLVLLHVTAVIFILLQKLLYHISKQCRPLSDIFFSSTICLVSTLDLHCLSNSFIYVRGLIGLTDCVQIMS